MLVVLLPLMETPANGIVTLALHMYIPPWKVRRGLKVMTRVSGYIGNVDIPSTVPFTISTPLGPTTTILGGSLRRCGRVTVQVVVRVEPATEFSTEEICTSGSAGAKRWRHSYVLVRSWLLCDLLMTISGIEVIPGSLVTRVEFISMATTLHVNMVSAMLRGERVRLDEDT